MGYKFQKGKMYRMPTHFGPSIGPRQGPDGQKFQCKDFPKTKSISVSFPLKSYAEIPEFIKSPKIISLFVGFFTSLYSAAAPAISGAAIEVPFKVAYPPFGTVLIIFTPGAINS